MKLNKQLKGDRIFIRDYSLEDKEFCSSMWFDRENGKYLCDPTKEYMDDVYSNAINSMEDNQDGYYLVVCRSFDQMPIGSCCIFPETDGTLTVDIGYCIHKYFWRNGFASEMMEVLIAWSKEMGYQTITAEVAKENTASNALLNKFGFHIRNESSFKKYNMDQTFESYIMERNL